MRRPADHAVQLREGYLDVPEGNARMPEALRVEMLDQPGGQLADKLHATISAAVPTMREKRGTVLSKSICAQNSMSASSPGGP